MTDYKHITPAVFGWNMVSFMLANPTSPEQFQYVFPTPIEVDATITAVRDPHGQRLLYYAAKCTNESSKKLSEYCVQTLKVQGFDAGALQTTPGWVETLHHVTLCHGLSRGGWDEHQLAVRQRIWTRLEEDDTQLSLQVTGMCWQFGTHPVVVFRVQLGDKDKLLHHQPATAHITYMALLEF
jgi:hypothetical protein